jgi:hypothetical protein
MANCLLRDKPVGGAQLNPVYPSGSHAGNAQNLLTYKTKKCEKNGRFRGLGGRRDQPEGKLRSHPLCHAQSLYLWIAILSLFNIIIARKIGGTMTGPVLVPYSSGQASIQL